MKIKTAVVPIAGWGTRLLPVSLMVAKEFLPLGRKPAIQHICEQLADAGVERIIFVCSERKGNVTQLFESNEALIAKLTGAKASIREQFWSTGPFDKVQFETTIQREQLGLGHAVLCAKQLVGDEPFLLALGDCPIGVPGQSQIVQRMVEQYERHDAQIVISFEQVTSDRIHKYGVAKPGARFENGFVVEDLIEKPTAASAPSNLAICGRYVLSAEVFSVLQNQHSGHCGEIQLTDAIRSMIQNGAKAIGVPLADGEFRYDVGGMESYVQSFVEFAVADPELRQWVEAALERQSQSAK